MKKYYKVVDRGTLDSARAEKPVKYKVDKWVNAPGDTRLFVFDSLRDARRFRSYDEEIYECEVKGGVKLSGAAWDYGTQEFWRLFNAKIRNKEKITREYMEKRVDLAETPAVLVKSVKLKTLIY